MPKDVATEDDLVEIKLDTLFGDIRDIMLDRLRALPKPWSVLSESEQSDWIIATERTSRYLVNEAAKIIAAQGRPVVVASLAEFKLKDGVEAKLKAQRTETNVVSLNNALGQEVLIVVAEQDAYYGERAPATPDPDEPELPTGEPGGGNVSAFKSRQPDE